MADLSDPELLARFRAGDADALDLLFERYETPLYNFLRGVLRDPHLAEDALQETFVRALQRLDGVDPAHLRGWLFTVAYHQGMLIRRRNASRLRHVCLDGKLHSEDTVAILPGPLEHIEQADDAARLRALLEQLPLSQREVIHRRVYEGKKFREIADELGCPLNTALARMHEGLKRLRLLWGECHG